MMVGGRKKNKKGYKIPEKFLGTLKVISVRLEDQEIR